MTSTAGRLVRSAVVVLLLVGGSAGAAGTGGIEVSPYPGIVDGKQVTAFKAELPRDGGEREVQYSLRNTTRQSRSAKLYAASASPDPKGGFTVGEAGSSPYIDFPTQQVTLQPGASEIAAFTVRGELDEDAYGAIVVEVQNGSITSRAATIVYLSPGPVLPVPVLLALGAGVLVLAAGFAVWFVRRTRAA